MHQNDKKIKNIISRLIFYVMIVMILFVVVSMFNVFSKKSDIEAEMGKASREKMTLLEKKEELVGLADYFQDKNFIEKEARRRLNLQMPGEQEVIVIDKRENGGGDKDKNTEGSDAGKVSDILKEMTGEDRLLANPLKWYNFIFEK